MAIHASVRQDKVFEVTVYFGSLLGIYCRSSIHVGLASPSLSSTKPLKDLVSQGSCLSTRDVDACLDRQPSLFRV